MFSVVIPVYNHQNYLHDAVISALQSKLVTEVLMVDDGSTDSSPDIIASFARQHPNRVHDLTPMSSGNKGAHIRLNQLCEIAKNEWIAVLNSDDEFVPGRFDIVQALIRTTQAELICGTLAIIDDLGRVIGRKSGLLDPEYAYPAGIDANKLDDYEHIVAALCNQNIVATTSNMIFRKSLFHEIGGFDDLRYAHDWKFVLQAAMLGKLHITSSYLTKYRLHGTNTIKEKSGHIDGEIRRFFYGLLDRNKQIEESAMCKEALVGNEHLKPFILPHQISNTKSDLRPVSFDWPRTRDFYSVRPRSFSAVSASESDSYEYVLSCRSQLNSRVLENAAAAIQMDGYDFILISHSLEDAPFVTVNQDDSVDCIHNKRAESLFLQGHVSHEPLRGRLIRYAPKDVWPRQTVSIQSLRGFDSAVIQGSEIEIGGSTKKERVSGVSFPTISKGDGPLILVLPIFLAVGGVERNTIEVIRALSHRYRFLVVTTERQMQHQGSLHFQLDEMKVPVLDLAEICDRSRHVTVMAAIRDDYRPDAVWICNGSPWLADNAEQMRRIFSRTPIVDQQVYDTEHGWINRYNEPGIQSFDHFIAINKKIQTKFLSNIRIPPHRVSLIYSAIDTTKLSRPLADSEEAEKLRSNLGLTEGVRCFAFIGRLTAQKRPLQFLELAKTSLVLGRNDKFLLVGDGELGSECDQFIAQNNMHNVVRIKFYDDSWAMMNVIDGLIITSAFEGLPIVLLEALSFGRPAFSSDVGDIEVVLDEYRAGSVFAVDATTEEVWDRFMAWRADLDLFSANARKCRNAILSRFSSRSISKQYGDIFDSLIKF